MTDNVSDSSPALVAARNSKRPAFIARLIARWQRWLDKPTGITGWSSRHWSEADDVS